MDISTKGWIDQGRRGLELQEIKPTNEGVWASKGLGPKKWPQSESKRW